MGYSEKIVAWPIGYGGATGLYRSGNPNAFWNAFDRVMTAQHTKWVTSRHKWADLETSLGVYDWTVIDECLSRADAAGKKWIFYAYDSLAETAPAVPNYILNDIQYGGPTAGRYGVIEMKQKVNPKGWVLRRWNSNITTRLNALYSALVAYADANYPNVMGGLIADESAAGINWITDPTPSVWYELDTDPTVSINSGSDFRIAYETQLKLQLAHAHDTVFSGNRNVIFHLNSVPFGQGEPFFDNMVLWCSQNNIGIGAPDTNPQLVADWGIMQQIRDYNRQVPCQIGAQIPFYHADGTRFTQLELLQFARTGPALNNTETTTLDGAITAGSTSITLANTTIFRKNFNAYGAILIDNEVITYESKSGFVISDLTRGAFDSGGIATTAASHSDGVIVTFLDSYSTTLQTHYYAFKANEVAVWDDVNNDGALQTMVANEIIDPQDNWATWSEAGGTYYTGTVAVSPANINAGDTITITVVDQDLNTSAGSAQTTTVEVDNDITGENETVTLTETGNDTGIFVGTLATQFGTTAGTNDDGVMDCDGGHTFTITYSDANDANGNPANPTTAVTVSSQPTWSNCAVNEHQQLNVIAVSSENANVGTNIDDGSLSSYWSPASADSPTINQWAILDMGASKLMSSINTTFRKYDLGTTNYKIDYSNQGSDLITNITAANPVVVTASNTYSNTETVTLWNTGVPELDGRQFTVASVSGTGYTLSGEDGTSNTAYVSGGESQVFSWTAGIASKDSTLSAQWENEVLIQTARYVRLYLNSRSDSEWLQTFECEVCAVATTGTGATSTIYTEVDPPLTLEATTLATWQDRDLSAYTGITFAIVRRQNTSGSQRQIGVRENGDTTASSQYDMRAVSQDVVIVPVDASGIIEVYEEVLADSTIDLIGYLTGGTKTTRTSKIPAWTSSTWYTVDGSSLTGGDTAIAYLVHIVQTTGRKIGLRPNGSTEGDFEGAFLGSMITMVGADGSELFELYQAFAAVARIDILGYFTSADDLTVLTTFEDITPTGLAAYEEKTISTDTAGIVAYISGATESQDFAIRNADITLDYYYSTQRACSAFAAACSSENKVDVKAENADTNFRVPIKFNRTATTVNPTAVDDIASVATGAASLLIDVLANDYDPEFGVKTITSLTQPSTGTTAVSSGKVLYTPSAGNVNLAHTETFTYKITSDGTRESEAVATVTVVWNDTPTADNFTIQAAPEDVTFFDVITLSGASDTAGQELTLSTITTPANGIAVISGNREVTYTSNSGFIGIDTFDVTITDGFTDGDVIVTMTVVVGTNFLQQTFYWDEQ